MLVKKWEEQKQGEKEYNIFKKYSNQAKAYDWFKKGPYKKISCMNKSIGETTTERGEFFSIFADFYQNLYKKVITDLEHKNKESSTEKLEPFSKD